MKPVYFIVLAILILILIWYFTSLRNRQKKVMDSLDASIVTPIKEKSPYGKKVIRIEDVDEEKAARFISDFISLYKGSDHKIVKPEIGRKNGSIVLLFPSETQYYIFCWWVNYLTYSEKSHRQKVTGWYGASEIEGDTLGLSNSYLMLFVPETDKEYDNVFLTSQNGICFKQEFAFPENLYMLKTRIREYEDCP